MSLLRDHADFRRLWVADSVVDLAERLHGVALPWFVLATTGDPLSFGLAFALRTTPDLLAAPLLGYLADAVDRRRLLTGALLAETFMLAAVPVAALAGRVTVPLVYGVLVALSVCYAAYNDAREAALPALVGETRLDEANAAFHGATDLLSVTFLLAGGALTATLGPVTTAGLSAAVLPVAVVLVGRLPALAPGRSPAGSVRVAYAEFLASVREGWAVVRGTRIADVLALGAAINVVVVPYGVLSGVIGRPLGGAVAWTALQAGFKTGSLAGNLVVPRLDWSRERTFVAGVSGVAVTLLALSALGPPVAALSPRLALVGTTGLFLLFGAVQPLHNVPSDSMVQARATETTRGQVVALTNAGVQVGFPVGYLGAGALAESVSPFTVFGLAGGIAVGLAVVAALRFRP